MKHRLFSTLCRSSRLMRRATAVVIAGQIVIGAPTLAQDATQAVVKAGTRAARDLERKAAKARVKVNRTVPTVTPPSLEVTFGADVTTEQLRRARVFGELLTPTREPGAEDNRALDFGEDGIPWERLGNEINEALSLPPG
jgi:hypothetical protein